MRRTIQIHRSYRKALVYPEPEQPRKVGGKKNTRRWCRGRVGLAHTPAWMTDPGGLPGWMVYACTKCGRHLDGCGRFSQPCKCGTHSKH
jgi:hypothetical protein